MTSLVDRWDLFRIDDKGRERPGRAAAVLSSLADAQLYGGYAGDRLTRDEYELIKAVEYRLRGRLGETRADGEPLDVLGDVLLRHAVKKIQEP